jgi:type IV pilus assembly protein PilB
LAKFDKRLATILAKQGMVAEDSRDEFLAAAEGAGVSLTEYLVNGKVLTETDIIGAVSAEMNIPPIDVSKVELDPEALELVPEDMATLHGVLPIARIGKTLTLAVANPMDVTGQDNINVITGCELMPVVSTDLSIRSAIQRAYGAPAADMEGLVADMGFGEDEMELADGAGEGADSEITEAESKPAVKLVQLILAEGVRSGAAGIHIEPYEKRSRVRYRIDGACAERLNPPKHLHSAVVSRIKIMANMDISEHQKTQGGKFKMKFGKRDIDFRVSILPLVYGEKVVMRILDASAAETNLDNLGFEKKALADFSEAIKSANGMVLVTGPTGCGKTTTLYSAIKKIVCIEDNITTVEDPVEYTLEGVNQVQVNERRGLTFAAALRSILRQDPDIVFIGEIRDQETAEIAVKAALTGHLVFSTLHTNNAPATVTRLLNMGVDNFLVASTLILVSAQRLVRRLCPECKESYKATEEQMREWGLTNEEIAAEPDFFRPRGCGRCGDIGYKGRLALMETLVADQKVREIIVSDASVVAIKRRAMERGMLTLRRVGLLNAMRGNASMQEVLSSTMPD